MAALLIIWVLFAIGVGAYAAGRGRDMLVWTGIALVISPLICIVILAVSPEVKSAANETATPVTVAAATATELLRRVEELFDRGALTDGDLGRLRALAARELPAPKPPEQKAASSEFTRPCPSCGGFIHPQAITCMHCWTKLPRLAA